MSTDPRPGPRVGLRVAAEAILCEVTGATRVVRLCPYCGSGDHGQPRLVGSPLRVSIAYAAGLVAVAWGEDPVGVDVETATHRPSPGMPDPAGWTRIEALAKAAGTGLRGWPDVTLPRLPTRRLGPADGLPEGYVGTLAGAAAGGVRLAGPAVAGAGSP